MILGLGVIKGVVVTDLEQAKVIVDLIGQVESDHVEHIHDDEKGIHLDRVADQDELINGQSEEHEIGYPGGRAQMAEKSDAFSQRGGIELDLWGAGGAHLSGLGIEAV